VDAGPFDLVIAGGRVLDPESGLDEVRNVAGDARRDDAAVWRRAAIEDGLIAAS
jgi:hypothetical protein